MLKQNKKTNLVTLKLFLTEWAETLSFHRTFVPWYESSMIIQQKVKQILWTQDALAAEKEMQSACVMIVNLGDKN